MDPDDRVDDTPDFDSLLEYLKRHRGIEVSDQNEGDASSAPKKKKRKKKS